MEMDFINVVYDDRDYIAHLVPRSLLKELKQPNQFAMALGVNENGKSNEIVGAVSFYVDVDAGTNSILTIRWFYIDPDYRQKGYAKALFDRLCELAMQNGVKQIKVFFPEMEDTLLFKHVFYEMDFSYRNKNVVEVYTTMANIYPPQNKVDGKVRSDRCVPLSEVEQKDFLKFYNVIPEKRKHLAEYLLPTDINSYDKAVSHVTYDKKGDIDAVFLVRYINEALEPILFYSAGNSKPSLLADLLSMSNNAIYSNYGADVNLRLRSTEETDWHLYEKILPKLNKDNRIKEVVELKLHYSIQGIMTFD